MVVLESSLDGFCRIVVAGNVVIVGRCCGSRPPLLCAAVSGLSMGTTSLGGLICYVRMLGGSSHHAVATAGMWPAAPSVGIYGREVGETERQLPFRAPVNCPQRDTFLSASSKHHEALDARITLSNFRRKLSRAVKQP